MDPTEDLFSLSYDIWQPYILNTSQLKFATIPDSTPAVNPPNRPVKLITIRPDASDVHKNIHFYVLDD